MATATSSRTEAAQAAPIVTVEPLSDAVGAQISGVDLSRALDEATMEAIHAAWLAHSVLLLRDQHLGHDDQIRFSRFFGELDMAPVAADGRMAVEGYPQMLIISNAKRNGRPIGALGANESDWHTDMSYVDVPPCGSSLYADTVPPAGGDTGFLSMYRAYESLSDAVRDQVADLKIKHDATYSSDGVVRAGFTETDDPMSSPGAVHPVVRTHPETGRKALFLGRRRNAYVVGMSLPDSEELLNALWSHVDQPQFAWVHQWRVGDLLLWDNRCVMHRRDAFDGAHERIMYRTQIKGDRPF